ncbi:hypothetical protein [Bradyrhizobium sp. STM 3561]|uniref:hypothetical protein n=1 Tax=Bradyrhizobium sp. STM 3561 TaxID=578923 RepID=UPI00388F4CCA
MPLTAGGTNQSIQQFVDLMKSHNLTSVMVADFALSVVSCELAEGTILNMAEAGSQRVGSGPPVKFKER